LALGWAGFTLYPALVRPVEANAAELEFALHAAQLRIGDRLVMLAK
jgi:hypothetical protein